MDNVIIASKILHHMKCKTKGKIGEVAFKINISKALDRVQGPMELSDGIDAKMGFNEK